MSNEFSSPNFHSTDPADVLGVVKLSDEVALRTRYLELVKQFPPDTFPVEFNAIHKAYELLSDPMRCWRQLLTAASIGGISAFLEKPSKAIQRLPTQYLIDLGSR